MGKIKANAAADGNAGATPASNVTSISAARQDGGAAGSTVAGDKKAAAAQAALVVFGRDDGGKPHASWFGAADTELATKAAGMMRFKVLPISSDEHRTAASGLAAGRVFASGRAFSPFCREAAYRALEAFPEAFLPPAPVEPEPVPPPAVTSTPQAWDNIGPGSLVLASMGDETGWFESVVVEARGDDLFVLRWEGWPDDPEFARRRHNLALLPAPAAEPA